mmetsp:Transcript_4116/g.5847  ORF Transcript_4116/g.5847 Transcript_4116/m.5847 type:complete len:301 (-) Transcript_4116:34-936(-)
MVDSKVDEWADIEDDEYQLPPREETKTSDGLKKVTEYSISVDGFLKKTITTTRENKVVHRVFKGAADRRGWKRFGQCANAPPGPEQGITAVSKDTVLIEWVTQIDEEEEENEDDTLEQAKQKALKELRMLQMQQRMKERNAGGVVTTQIGGEPAKPNWAQAMSMKAQNANEDTAAPKNPNIWVPSSLRGNQAAAAAEGTSGGYQRDDSATVRVSNISAKTTEGDLHELFAPFGAVKRVYLSRDRKTKESKDFAFVAFQKISDAQKCIQTLNGRPYDHLILQVEWAKPSEQRNPSTMQRPK